MAKTITISLPDEIYNRLQIYKDKFNLSAVCQEAILAEINRVQITANGDVFDFLGSGQQDSARASINMGRDDAQACIQKKLITYELMYSLWEKFRSEETIDKLDCQQVVEVLGSAFGRRQLEQSLEREMCGCPSRLIDRRRCRDAIDRAVGR